MFVKIPKWFLIMCCVVNVAMGTTPTLNEIGKRRMPSSYCETEDNVEGRCVKPSECEKMADEVDLSKLEVYRLSTCHYLNTCCPLNMVKNSTDPPIVKNQGCGYGNPSPFAFLKESDVYAEYGEFPWMVALLRKKDGIEDWQQEDYLGGGSIIHEAVVMTAAHKVYKLQANEIKCRAGEWDTKTNNEAYPHQERDVKTIVVHPEFVRRAFKNNVALLLLETPYDFNVPHISPACIVNEIPTDRNCYSMGWGQKEFNKDAYAVILKKISSPLQDASVCEKAFRPIVGQAYVMDKSMLCAGGVPGLSNCMGDGGSPLICPISESQGRRRFSVVGIVAVGHQCGAGFPVGFTKVPEIFNWVHSTMKSYNYESTYLI